MYNDTVSDFVTRVRNAFMAKKPVFMVRSSKLVEQLANIFKKQGYFLKITKNEEDRTLEIEINPEAVIGQINRLSRPGIRRYVSYQDIPRPRSGFGLVILTTPKGVLTGPQAHKQKVGGELICEVW